MDMKVFLETYKGAFIRLFCVREALGEMKGLAHYAPLCCDEAPSDGHYVDQYVFWSILLCLMERTVQRDVQASIP